MTGSSVHRKAEAAWDRIEALGGHGVWNGEMVFVSFAGTKVTDDDLILFHDFPYVQVLDLSGTGIGDGGLAHLAELKALEEFIVVGTKVSGPALATFRHAHPTVKVVTELPKGGVNRFTGLPL